MPNPAAATKTVIPLPSFAPTFSATVSQLRRVSIPLHDRLQSIATDAAFVSRIACEWSHLPVIANERCGSWYVDPTIKMGSAYFKSTDGHVNEWTFSLRRLNLDVLRIIGKHGGCMIVDSTRRGKLMPDALAKTVPVWCAVFNALLFPSSKSCELATPRSCVPPSEHDQILRRIDEFIERASELGLDMINLRQQIKKPLKPLWRTPTTDIEGLSEGVDYFPVLLVTASRLVTGSDEGYIQGAGDDTEAWAHGLRPDLFWTRREELLSASEEVIPDLIESLTQQPSPVSIFITPPTLVTQARRLYICPLASIDSYTVPDYRLIITMSSEATCSLPQPTGPAAKTPHMHLTCPAGKSGSQTLRSQLPQLLNSNELIKFCGEEGSNALVACETAKDFSIGVALAIICRFVSDEGSWRLVNGANIDKMKIKRRLGWITAALPQANPSRATLTAVNHALMSSSSGAA